MAAPVGSFDWDYSFSGADLLFDLPGVVAGQCQIIVVSTSDGAAPGSLSGIPVRFGAAVKSFAGADNRGFVYVYNADTTVAGETLTLATTDSGGWTAGGCAFDTPLSVAEIDAAQTYGGEVGYPMTAPDVNVPAASSTWVQIIITAAFSRFFTPPGGVTRHGMATSLASLSLTGFAVGYKAVGAGATGVSGEWEAANTDGGSPLVGTQYRGVSLALSPAAGTISVNWSAEMDFTETAVLPTITTPQALPSATLSVAYTTTVSATGTTPITWSVASGILPVGLSLNASTGVISGTPTVVSNTSLTIRATNAAGSADKVFSLAVTGTLPSITTSGMPAGTVGVSYSAALLANGTTPITWSVVGGALPPGLSLSSSTGAVTGTPSQSGTFTATFRATNAVGSVDRALGIVVAAAGTAPAIAVGGVTSGTVAEAFSLQLSATGSTPITWAVQTGSLPAGLVINGETGLIAGVPTDAGTYAVTIRATNDYGTGDRSYTFTIAAAADPDPTADGYWVIVPRNTRVWVPR